MSSNTSNNISENSIIENPNKRNAFIEPKNEIQLKNLFEDSYYFKQDIERVWIILRSFDILSILCSKGHYPCIYLKGKDTWTKGNEFKGNIFGQFPFIAKVRNSLDLPEIKRIEFIIDFKIDYILMIFELFKVTEDNSTVVIKTIKRENELINDEEKAHIKMIEKKLFEKIDKILETEPISLLK